VLPINAKTARKYGFIVGPCANPWLESVYLVRLAPQSLLVNGPGQTNGRTRYSAFHFPNAPANRCRTYTSVFLPA
jgi:hypothetical protein